MAITQVPDDTAGKIKRNAEILLKSASTYVTAAITACAIWYASKSAPDQAAFLLAHPVLVPVAPYAGFLAFIAARLAPSNIRLSGDREARMGQLLDWLIERGKAVQAGDMPPVAMLPPPALTAGLKPADVATTVSTAAAAQTTTIVPPPAAPPPPANTVVLDPMELVRPKFPGATDAEILALLSESVNAATPEVKP